MNIISYILLSIVATAFLAAIRWHYKGRGKKSCCGRCDGCHLCD